MARKKRGNKIDGWVFFNKPYEMTSTQAVGFIRKIFNAQKAGHGGTLDPLAVGVLPIALGEATKTVPFIMDSKKVYKFTVSWGQETNTDDKEGEVINSSQTTPKLSEVEALLPNFIGEIEQTPPQFSAVKIAGEAAYKAARRGESVEIKPKTVNIHSLEIVEHTGGFTTFMAEVGKGTYVRSIARDMGRKLGCYGYISYLERSKVGKFNLNDCTTKEKLDKYLELGHSPEEFLKVVDVVLDDIPAYKATFEEERQFKEGRTVVRVHLKEGLMKVLAQESGKVISIVNVDKIGQMNIVRNFNCV